MQKLRWVTGFVLAALLGFGVDALAGGFAFNENGAAATGKATAFVGEANDPSAIFYNPAGITQLPGTQVMIGASLVKLDSTFRSSTTVESTQLQDQFPVLPYVYITHRFKGWDERLSIGLGIYTPFGILIDWPDNWQGRFATTDDHLRVTVYNPTIAFQATPKLSLAVGLQSSKSLPFRLWASGNPRSASTVWMRIPSVGMSGPCTTSPTPPLRAFSSEASCRPSSGAKPNLAGRRPLCFPTPGLGPVSNLRRK